MALVILTLPFTSLANDLEIEEILELSVREQLTTEFKTEVFRLTNEEREKVNLKPLKTLTILDELAQTRANEIGIIFAHMRPNGKKWFTVFEDTELKYKIAGENLAFGFNRPSDLVDAWMTSQNHRANILNPDFEHLGVGFFKDEKGRVYVSLLFFKTKPNKRIGSVK